MDALDRRLLRQVQEDCSVSATQLAERCGTTESTVLRRLKKLRRDGVIRGQVALIDAAKVGRVLTVWVTVRLEREDMRAIRAFVESIRAHPDVLQFHFVTGTSDYLILLSVRSMEDYHSFLQDYLVPNPLVVMSDTNVVIRALKMSTVIPIDDL